MVKLTLPLELWEMMPNFLTHEIEKFGAKTDFSDSADFSGIMVMWDVNPKVFKAKMEQLNTLYKSFQGKMIFNSIFSQLRK